MTAPIPVLSGPGSPLFAEQAAATQQDSRGVESHAERLKRIRGSQYPAQDAPDARKLEYIKQLWQESNSDALARYRQATKNICYDSGRQHISWSARSKTWEDLPMVDPNEVRVTMNYIRPILRARTQRMLSAPVDPSLTPDSNSQEARDRSQIGERFLDARWRLTGMRGKVENALGLAFNCGVAALKSFWNQDLGPLKPATIQQVRRQPALDSQGQPIGADASGEPITEPVLDEQGQPIVDTLFVDEQGQPVETEAEAFHYRPGDTDTAVRTVFNVRVNPDAVGWTPGEGLRWLIDTEVVPVSVARERYPDFADKIQVGAQPDVSLTYERLAQSAATQRPVLGGTTMTAAGTQPNKQNKDTCTLREYWELPTKECYPDGRLIVAVGDVIVYDHVFPQAWFPYAPIFDEPAPLTPYGRPSVNDLTSPQDLINRNWTAVDGEMQLAGVGQVVSWDIRGLQDQLTSQNRTIIKVPYTAAFANRSIRDVFHRMDPAQIPSDRWRIIAEAKQTMFDIGGFHEVTRGETPPGVDSGVAIEHLLEAEAGQLQKSMLALGESLKQWMRCQLAIAVAEYGPDEERWIPVDRPDLGYQVESVKGLDLPDPQTVVIELENFKAHSESARRAEVKELAKDGMIGPRQALKALDLGTGMNAVVDSQSRHYARARSENLAIQKGAFQLVPSGPDPNAPPALVGADGVPFLLAEDDDHALHMETHDEIVLDNSIPWPTRQAAIAHKAEHRAVMQMLQAQAAPPPPGPAQ